MSPKKRLLIYLLLFIVYYVYTLGITNTANYINTSLFTYAYICFAVLDALVARLYLKTGLAVSVLTGAAIGVLALFIASKIADLRFVTRYDAYGILTVIFGNIILSLLLWELAFQLKQKLKPSGITKA